MQVCVSASDCTRETVENTSVILTLVGADGKQDTSGIKYIIKTLPPYGTLHDGSTAVTVGYQLAGATVTYTPLPYYFNAVSSGVFKINASDTTFNPCVGLSAPCICHDTVNGCPDTFTFTANENGLTSGAGTFSLFVLSNVSLSGFDVTGVQSVAITPVGNNTALTAGLSLGGFDIGCKDGDVYPIGLSVTLVDSALTSGLGMTALPSGANFVQCTGGDINSLGTGVCSSIKLWGKPSVMNAALDDMILKITSVPDPSADYLLIAVFSESPSGFSISDGYVDRAFLFALAR